jgi:hypothetical protein
MCLSTFSNAFGSYSLCHWKFDGESHIEMVRSMMRLKLKRPRANSTLQVRILETHIFGKDKLQEFQTTGKGGS